VRQPLVAAALLLLVAAPAAAPLLAKTAGTAAEAAIAKAVADPRRKPENSVRDRYRHPVETLSFFGVGPDSTVVEIWPSGGWYAEILGPLLRDHGHYIAAAQPEGKYRIATETLLASDPARFGRPVITSFAAGKPSAIAPAGTADTVLTFRNVHNMMMTGDGAAEQAFRDFYAALKPGGVLGVVEHRLPEDKDSALEKTSGYVKKSTVMKLAEAAGFRLAGESEINANPKDTHDWPKGVWTLPPTLTNGAVDRDKYIAIGESDRMTLKFVKPKA
jgi:predicted methyltransferase